MSETVVTFENVSKKYLLGLAAYRSLRDEASKLLGLLLGRRRPKPEPFWALKDVSFDIRRGETVGIIGPNGAGKSTALKLIAKITQPSSGRVTSVGRVASLIEVGTGFHLELTGRQNVFLNGSVLGMPRNEIEEKYDQIVEFSEIGGFMDTPVKKYSSGMYARLGFSVAAHVNPDILLVDEVLSVGDFGFQQKCIRHMEELRQKGTTVVFVSHNLQSVSALCDRGILVHQGAIQTDGPVGDAIGDYHALLATLRPRLTHKGGRGKGVSAETPDRAPARIENVHLISGGGATHVLPAHQRMEVRIRAHFDEDLEGAALALNIANNRGMRVYDLNTARDGFELGDFKAGQEATFSIALKANLIRGQYHLSAGLIDPKRSEYIDWRQNVISFFIENPSSCKGVADMAAEVEVRRGPPQPDDPPASGPRGSSE
jgi:homopolymeric O-antigen transport system ATP-binding protein